MSASQVAGITGVSYQHSAETIKEMEGGENKKE
jgi:hypothetical protein